MNFDEYNNSNQYDASIENPFLSIYLQRAKLQILEHQACEKKIIVFLDKKNQDHKKLVSYYQKSHSQKLSAMDPCIYFELNYRYVVSTLSEDNVIFLHEYINSYLSSNHQSSTPIDEKESESISISSKIII